MNRIEYEDVKSWWNLGADEHNQWSELDESEKVCAGVAYGLTMLCSRMQSTVITIMPENFYET